MNVNQPTPLSLAIAAALILASSGNLLADTSKTTAETAPAAETAAPASDTAKPAADQPDTGTALPVVVDEGTAITNQEAIEALQHIDAANKALADKDIKTAQEALTEADKLLRSLNDSLPTAKVKQQVEAAKQSPEDADWTSIYQQLDQIMLFLPQAMTKQAGDTTADTTSATDDKATTDTRSATDDKTIADNTAKPATPSAESLDVVLVALQYTEIDLPVKTAISSVEKARQALKKEDIKSAAKALKSAENNVVILQNVAEDPLFQAHLSLWQALANLKNGSTEEARQYLDNALSFLQKAAQSTDKATKQAADKLLKEGEDLKAELDKSTADDNDTMTGKLERFGMQAEAWAERAMNYAYTKAAEVTGNALKDALIETRFHLSNAGIDLYTAQDPAAAKQELEQAQTYLKQALQQSDDLWSDAAYKQQVTDMQTQLDKLLQEQPEQLAGNSQLHQLRQALQTVIHAL
jgi:cellobiose-specific phosphotransferase system component IIA